MACRRDRGSDGLRECPGQTSNPRSLLDVLDRAAHRTSLRMRVNAQAETVSVCRNKDAASGSRSR